MVRPRISLLGIATAYFLFSVLLAYAVNWKRARQRVLQYDRVEIGYPFGVPPHAPLILRAVGENGHFQVLVRRPGPGELERIQRLFPEAEVEEFFGYYQEHEQRQGSN